MTAMTCSEFENALAELLASPGAAGGAAVVDALRVHAAACVACSGSSTLLDLAVRPAGERDPIDDPGGDYWEAFSVRLAARLRQERSRTRRRIVMAAAAAAAAVTAVTVVFLRGPSPGPTPVATPIRVPYVQETPLASAEGPDAPDVEDDGDLEFVGAGPLDAYAEDDAGVLFPSVEGLAPADQKRLLEWLTEEESKAKRGAA
jgi:hypothetical protein